MEPKAGIRTSPQVWALEDAIREAPAAAAWELVVTLLRRAPDENLRYYAAGPLENLVVHRGAELIREIEREAAQDPRFRWALGCIWLSRGELPAAILARVVRASGGAIHPLPPLDELEAIERGSPDAQPGIS